MQNVILITIDSLAAGDMSLYGYDLPTTPRLSQFAKQAYVFDAMYASSTSSLPGFFSIFSGRYPRRNYLRNMFYFTTGLVEGYSIVGILKKLGYTVFASLGLMNYCLGMDNSRPILNLKGACQHPLLSRFYFYDPALSLERTFKTAVTLLKNNPAPFLIWIHIYPPHDPYLPSYMFRGCFLRNNTFHDYARQRPYIRSFYKKNEQPAIDRMRYCYNEQILEVDEKLGMFLAFMEQEGYFKNSILIITSDHGESFERGYAGHCGPYLYNPLIRIPLMIRLPGQSDGKRVDAEAGQVDLAPTILDLLGQPVPEWMDGESLVGLMQNHECSRRPVLTTNSQYKQLLIDRLAIMHDGYKLIYAPRHNALELYNLRLDKTEYCNLAVQDSKRAAFLKSMLLNRLAEIEYQAA